MTGKKVDDNASKDGVMILSVISDVGGGSSYPAHTKTNDSDWALVI
jgi:5-deoxy-D-glucuronate isomerase